MGNGDPAAQYRTLEMTDEEYEQLKTELGYNDPVIVQYGRWLGNVLHGDFGVSTSSHTGVWPLIKAKLPATVGLMAASIVFSLLVSIPLGMLAGWLGAAVVTAALGLTLPPLVVPWMALLGLWLGTVAVAVVAGLIPARRAGRVTPIAALSDLG